MKCTNCKIQYIREAENEFNIRPNNYQKDVCESDAIPGSHHFQDKKHNLNTHAIVILMEQQMCYININKEENNERIKGILTPKTLMPKDFNQELNIVVCIILFTYFDLPSAC